MHYRKYWEQSFIFQMRSLRPQKGEVTIPGSHQLSKALSFMCLLQQSQARGRYNSKFEETLSVPVLLIKQHKQCARATAPWGCITFPVASTARAPLHSHDSSLAPWFPNCDLFCALFSKNLFQENRSESTAVRSNQFDGRVFLAEANTKCQNCPLCSSCLTKLRGSLAPMTEPRLVFPTDSFSFYLHRRPWSLLPLIWK